MAVNVVIALYYYLRWTALLFRGPEGAEGSEGAGARTKAPWPVAAAIVATAITAVVLSGAPQLVLRVASGSLFTQ